MGIMGMNFADEKSGHCLRFTVLWCSMLVKLHTSGCLHATRRTTGMDVQDKKLESAGVDYWMHHDYDQRAR